MNPFSPQAFSSRTLMENLNTLNFALDLRYGLYAEDVADCEQLRNLTVLPLMYAAEMPILAFAQYVEKNTESESLKLAAKTIQTLPAKAICTFATIFATNASSFESMLKCSIPSFTLLVTPGMLALAKGCANYAENEALAEKIENASEIYMNAIKVLNIAIGIIALTAPIYFGTATLSLTTVIAVISVGSMIYNALETNNLLPTFETSQEAIA